MELREITMLKVALSEIVNTPKPGTLIGERLKADPPKPDPKVSVTTDTKTETPPIKVDTAQPKTEPKTAQTPPVEPKTEPKVDANPPTPVKPETPAVTKTDTHPPKPVDISTKEPAKTAVAACTRVPCGITLARSNPIDRSSAAGWARCRC